MNNETNFFGRIIAFLGYFVPVIGWMIPLFLTRNATLQHHGRQAFLLVFVFVSNAIFYYFITRLIPIQYELVENIIWLVILALYIGISIFFAFRSIFCKNADMPFVYKFSHLLPL